VECRVRDEATLARLSTGELSPTSALATGALAVRGDVLALRALQPLLSQLEAPSPLGIDGHLAKDGVAFYVVHKTGEAPKLRRFSEFYALKNALEARGVKARVRFPSRFGDAAPSPRQKALEKWLRSVGAAASRRQASDPVSVRVIAAFCGAKAKDALEGEVTSLKTRVVEPEKLFCSLAANATHVVGSAVATLVLAAFMVGVAAAACYGVRAAGLAFSADAAMAPYVDAAVAAVASGAVLAISRHFMCHAHVKNLACAFCCMVAWRASRKASAKKADDAKEADDQAEFSFLSLGGSARPLAERLALRFVGEVLASLALADAGLLVKLGQVLASMSGVLAAEMVEPLTSLVDSMPPMAPRARRSLLARAKRDSRLRLPEVLSDTARPIASASIAEVHHIGAVALKLQKPGLRRKFAAALRSARQIASLAAWCEPGAPDLTKLIDDATELHMRELDFDAEARALKHARESLKRRGIDAVVPEPLFDVADTAAQRHGILAMQWCQGGKVADVLAEASDDSLRFLATALVDAFACVALLGGLINLDPHAGNVLVQRATRANGEAYLRPVLLDWGMHEFLSTATRLGIAGLLRAVARQDAAALQTCLASLGVKSAFGAEADLQQMTFVLRNSQAKRGADVADVAAMAAQIQQNVKIAEGAAAESKTRIVEGTEVLNSFIRMLDLLHSYVADLPVDVDFLGICAKWADLAISEHEAAEQAAGGGKARTR